MMQFMLAAHLLGVVLWVGGMAFAITILRPSLMVLEPPQRIAVHAQVFARFFRTVWHAMPIVLLSGYGMLGLAGGFAGVGWPVHVMHTTGLIMSAIFAWIFFFPWRTMRTHVTAGDIPAAATAANRIRIAVSVNLLLGLITVVVAAVG